MAGKIFYRERTKVGEKERKPRFILVAVSDVNVKVFAKHIRKSELETIATSVGAELVLLPGGEGHRCEEEEVEVEEEK